MQQGPFRDNVSRSQKRCDGSRDNKTVCVSFNMENIILIINKL